MKVLLKDEKGLTLLEILLSISLLSIVLLIFFGFFIQSNTFASQSKSQLTGSQLSQEILEKVKSNYPSIQSSLGADQYLTTAGWNTLYQTNITGEYYIQINSQKFYPRVKIIPANQQNASFSDQLMYIQVEIGVYQKGTWVKKFETYGFKGN